MEELAKVMIEQARLEAEVQGQLVAGIVRANDNLASLHDKLLTTLPALATATRPHGKRFVEPVGTTCSEIIQFPRTLNESRITEPEAEVIRGDRAMEVDPMQTFRVRQISEINLNTGHCVLDLEDGNEHVPGKITDPALQVPNNVYTRSLNDHTPCNVQAKAVKKGGSIYRLYISNAE